MAEKDTPTTHTEPMTTEMMAAVDANNSSDEKPAKKSAPKKKTTVKKRAASKKKSSTKKKAAPKKKAAVKKSSVTKKKAAPKKKLASKKKSAVKKKSAPKKVSVSKTTASAAVTAAAPKQTSAVVDNKPEPQPTAKVTEKAETPVTPAETMVAATAETTRVSNEEKQHQQQIRQKLVDLGVADADEIGAVAHEEPQKGSGSFWIKAIIALLVLVGLYFYSKSSNDLSSTQLTSPPTVSPLENHPAPLEETTTNDANEVNSDEASLSESSSVEVLTTPNVNVVEVEADAAITTTQDAALQPASPPSSTETEQLAENNDSDENTASTATSPEAAATPEQMQRQYIPSYTYPNPWNPNYYPPFNAMNQMAPINPYNYPPINMAPGMVPPPYYNYPIAPYQPSQFAPTE